MSNNDLGAGQAPQKPLQEQVQPRMNDKITPSVWRQRTQRLITIHTLPSGQQIKMRSLTTPELYESGLQPVALYNQFKKMDDMIRGFEKKKNGKSKDEIKNIEHDAQDEILKLLSDSDMKELIATGRKLAVLAILEPALTFDVVKEPDKFPVMDIQFPDLMTITGLIMPQLDGKQFFREPGSGNPPSFDGEGVRSEAEPVPERVVD